MRISSLVAFSIVAAFLLVQGCSAPQEKPEPVLPHATADALSLPVLKGSTRLSIMSWPDQHWWEQWHDQQLNALVNAAIHEHPDMAVAKARLAVARAQADLFESANGPELDASASVNHERFSANSYIPPPYGGKVYDDTFLGLNGHWNLDLWGKQRALIKAELGEVRARQFESMAVEQALAADVVRTYVLYQLDGQRRELILERSGLIDQQTALKHAQAQAGIQAGDEQIQPHVQLLDQNESAEQLDAALNLLKVRLQALTGISARTLHLHAVGLPEIVPGLPGQASINLLGRRPDLAAARERVYAHWNQLHAAHQAFYPDIRLNALLGFSSLQISKLINSGSLVAGVQPALTLPLFDSGMLKQSWAIEDASLQQAIAQYRSLLTQSILDVQQSLLGVQSADAQLAILHKRLAQLDEAEHDARIRYQAGFTDAEPVLQAEQSILDLQGRVLDRRQQELAAYLDLIQALGGGFHDSRQVHQ